MTSACSSKFRRALILALSALSVSASAQVVAVDPVRQDGTAPGAPTSTFLWASPRARAVLIFLPGGRGRLKLAPGQGALGGFYAGVLKPLSDPALTSALFHVVVVDNPTDLADISRFSTEHLTRVDSVVRYYKARFNLPIWLMGHSNGAISMAEYFKKLQDAKQEIIIEGMVYSSARHSALFRSGTRAPILFLAHEKDGCINTTVYKSKSHYQELAKQGNTQSDFVLIHGGEAERDPCYSGFHMYHGAYEQVYQAIDAFASPRLLSSTVPAAVPGK